MLCYGLTEHRDAITESFGTKESPGKRTASTLANDTLKTLPCHRPQTQSDFFLVVSFLFCILEFCLSLVV